MVTGRGSVVTGREDQWLEGERISGDMERGSVVTGRGSEVTVREDQR